MTRAGAACRGGIRALTRRTLAQLVDTSRLIVWGNNAHLGDAQATEMGRRGGHTLGQLVRPEKEGVSHYFGASLAHQFDLVCHIDCTAALEPLDDGFTSVSTAVQDLELPTPST